MTQFEPDDEYRRRQRSRNIVTALLLCGLAILFFAVTLARLGEGH